MDVQQAIRLYALMQHPDFALFEQLVKAIEDTAVGVLKVTDSEIEVRRLQGECRRHKKILSLLEEARAMVENR